MVGTNSLRLLKIKKDLLEYVKSIDTEDDRISKTYVEKTIKLLDFEINPKSSQEQYCNIPNEEIITIMTPFLTQNEVKVVSYLANNEKLTASMLNKLTKIPRSEVYHLLESLVKKGVIVVYGFNIRQYSMITENALLHLIEDKSNFVEELKIANTKSNKILNKVNEN